MVSEIFAAGGPQVGITMTPGGGGVFEVKLDGQMLYDKKAAGKFPDLTDAKAIKAEVKNRLEAMAPV